MDCLDGYVKTVDMGLQIGASGGFTPTDVLNVRQQLVGMYDRRARSLFHIVVRLSALTFPHADPEHSLDTAPFFKHSKFTGTGQRAYTSMTGHRKYPKAAA